MFIAARFLSSPDYGAFLGIQSLTLLASTAWDFGTTSMATREVAAKLDSAGNLVKSIGRLRLSTAPLFLGLIVVGWVYLLGAALAPVFLALALAAGALKLAPYSEEPLLATEECG